MRSGARRCNMLGGRPEEASSRAPAHVVFSALMRLGMGLSWAVVVLLAVACGRTKENPESEAPVSSVGGAAGEGTADSGGSNTTGGVADSGVADSGVADSGVADSGVADSTSISTSMGGAPVEGTSTRGAGGSAGAPVEGTSTLGAGGSSGGTCAEGEVRCWPASDAARVQCIEGFWATLPNCVGNTPVCIGAGDCVACSEGAPNRCNPTHTAVENCAGNEWVVEQSCTGTEWGVCDNARCTSTILTEAWVGCGDSYCDTGTATCCANDPGTPYCSWSGCEPQVCAEGNVQSFIECDGPRDCPGQKCCRDYTYEECSESEDRMWIATTECKDSCSGNHGDHWEYELCDELTVCPAGSTCTLVPTGTEQLYHCEEN